MSGTEPIVEEVEDEPNGGTTETTQVERSELAFPKDKEDSATAVIKALQDSNYHQKILQSFGELQKASGLNPEAFKPPPLPDEKYTSFAEEVKNIPPYLWCLLAVVLIVLGFSQGFVHFLGITSATIGFIIYINNSTTKVKKQLLHQERQQMTAVSENIAAGVKDSKDRMAILSQQMHDKTLETVKSVVDKRAEVAKYKIGTMKEIETLRINTDLAKKNLEEEGQSLRTRMNNETKDQIARLTLKSQETVASINADSEKEKARLQKETESHRLTIQSALKQAELETQKAVVKGRQEVTKFQAEQSGRTEQAKINAEKETNMNRECNETEREKARMDHATKKAEIDARPKPKPWWKFW